MKNSIRLMLIPLLLLHGNIFSMNPFAMPEGLKSIKRPTKTSQAQPLFEKNKTAPLHKKKLIAREKTQLEDEISVLGDEIERLVIELAKIPEDKDLKQAIEAKKAKKSKSQSPAQPKKSPWGGYRPGTFKPSGSYGSSTFGRPSFGGGSAAFRRPGGTGFPSFGGGFSGFGGNRGGFGAAKSPVTSSKPDQSALRSFMSGSSETKSKDTVDKPTTPSRGVTSYKAGKNSKNDDTEAAIAKITGQFKDYVARLEKEITLINEATNKFVKSQKISNLPLGELNKLYEEVISARRIMQKEELSVLDQNPDWVQTKAKIASLQRKIAPILVERMLPLSSSELDKVAEAKKAFELLEIGSIVPAQTLQNTAISRCRIVAEHFRKLTRAKAAEEQQNLTRETTGKTRKQIATITQESKQRLHDYKKQLADELSKLISAFPGDKLGFPVPAILNEALTSLRS